LASLEAPLRLVDDVDASLAAHDPIVAMAAAERFQRITDFHEQLPAVGGCLGETLPACQRPRRLRGRNAGPRVRGGTPACLALTGRKSGERIDCLVPGSEHVAKEARHAVTAHGKLSHFVRHGPGAAAAGREECHVARPEAARCSALVGDENLA